MIFSISLISKFVGKCFEFRGKSHFYLRFNLSKQIGLVQQPVHEIAPNTTIITTESKLHCNICQQHVALNYVYKQNASQHRTQITSRRRMRTQHNKFVGKIAAKQNKIVDAKDNKSRMAAAAAATAQQPAGKRTNSTSALNAVRCASHSKTSAQQRGIEQVLQPESRRSRN